MVKLLEEKLKAVERLKSFTKEIISISPKTDHAKLCLMIAEREKQIQDIIVINDEIDRYLKSNKDYTETVDIKMLKQSIMNAVREIINMDKEIRGAVNNELKAVKNNLNQPDSVSRSINVKI